MNYLNRINLFLFATISLLSSHAEIREYKSQDLAAVCEIMKSQWAKLTTAPSYNQSMMDSMFIKQAPFDPSHKDKRLHIIVCEVDGQIVGFATYYYPSTTTGHVELLAVAPAHLSKGYGKKMMDHIQQEFIHNNAHHIQLYVYPSNPKAIDFYKHLGFTVKLRAIQQWLLSKILV
jgi:GNAT superfamily N-acetyltransferase